MKYTGMHLKGTKPHPQWIIVSTSVALIVVGFCGVELMSGSSLPTNDYVWVTPTPKPTTDTLLPPDIIPGPTVTVTRTVTRFVDSTRFVPGPTVRVTVTAKPEPVPTVTKTVRPSPVPGPTVTVTETVSATPAEEP
jgi:hypothetical protein